MAISISRHAERLTARRGVRLVAVAAVATTLVVACIAVSRSGLFSVRSIEVTGETRLSEGRIIARAHLGDASNTIWLDEAAAERRLERHAWIADANVSTALPSTVRIDVVERTPIAVTTDRFGDVYVAADGTPLGRAASTRGLPRITSAGDGRAAAAAALAAMRPALRGAVASVAIVDGGSLEVRILGGPTIEYGSADRFAAKALVLQRILAWAGAAGEDLVRVDVTSPAAPAVQLR